MSSTAHHAIDPPPPTHRPESSTDGLIRRLGARYLFVLVAVAILIVLDQVVIQPLLMRLDSFAPVINLSGRQRMLSQRLAKSALIIDRSKSAELARRSQEELKETLRDWTAAHAALQYGDSSQGIERISSPTIRAQWEKIASHFNAMAAAAQELIDVDAPHSNSARRAAVETIVGHESAFLTIMDYIVKLMETEAAREVWRLRALALGIAASIVGLIVGLGWFVVRPATKTIRSQVDELETRVVQRTAELAAALDSLQQEVAERLNVESKNQRLAAQLAHADRVESIGHLAVGLAHELNHPLGAIANYAEACDVLFGRGEELVQRRKLAEFIVQIREASLRAGKIVRRMRNFVQPNATESVEIEISDLIVEILALCQPELDKNQVVLKTEFAQESTLVSVDAIQIQQVIVNLVQNAIQAMADIPTHRRLITLRTTRIADQVRIDVADNGPGFESADPERIFEPFTSTKAEGLGVGLSICRSILENHRGTIWAESLSSGGAVVSFTLPIAATDAADRSLQAYGICC